MASATMVGKESAISPIRVLADCLLAIKNALTVQFFFDTATSARQRGRA